MFGTAKSPGAVPIYQSVVEAAETVVAVQGYILREIPLVAICLKLILIHIVLELYHNIHDITYLHHLQNSLTVNAVLVSV